MADECKCGCCGPTGDTSETRAAPERDRQEAQRRIEELERRVKELERSPA